jgi:uncharacterized protein (TIGR02246 family)
MSVRKYWTFAVLGLLAAAAGAFLMIARPDPNLATAAGQGADSKAPAGAEEQIRKANADYATALMAGNLDAIMAFWSSDADYIDEAGEMTRGSEKITELFRKALPEFKDTKVNIKVQSLRFLRPEICLEDGVLEKTSVTGIKESSRFAAVWTKTGDKWLISSGRDLPTDVDDLPTLAAAQLRDLEWLVGEWVDDGAKAEVTLKVTWASNKAFLLMDYVVKTEGTETLEVSVRVGWDARNGRVRSWVFDNQGGFGEGYWRKDGKRWVIGMSGILPDGGIGGSTNVYEFVDANTFVWRCTDRDVDGQPLADAEVKFVHKAAKK